MTVTAASGQFVGHGRGLMPTRRGIVDLGGKKMMFTTRRRTNRDSTGRKAVEPVRGLERTSSMSSLGRRKRVTAGNISIIKGNKSGSRQNKKQPTVLEGGGNSRAEAFAENAQNPGLGRYSGLLESQQRSLQHADSAHHSPLATTSYHHREQGGASSYFHVAPGYESDIAGMTTRAQLARHLSQPLAGRDLYDLSNLSGVYAPYAVFDALPTLPGDLYLGTHGSVVDENQGKTSMDGVTRIDSSPHINSLIAKYAYPLSPAEAKIVETSQDFSGQQENESGEESMVQAGATKSTTGCGELSNEAVLENDFLDDFLWDDILQEPAGEESGFVGDLLPLLGLSTEEIQTAVKAEEGDIDINKWLEEFPSVADLEVRTGDLKDGPPLTKGQEEDVSGFPDWVLEELGVLGSEHKRGDEESFGEHPPLMRMDSTGSSSMGPAYSEHAKSPRHATSLSLTKSKGHDEEKMGEELDMVAMPAAGPAASLVSFPQEVQEEVGESLGAEEDEEEMGSKRKKQNRGGVEKMEMMKSFSWMSAFLGDDSMDTGSNLDGEIAQASDFDFLSFLDASA